MWKSGGKSLDSVSTYVSVVKASDDTLLRALIKGVGGEENIGPVLYTARRTPSTRTIASIWEHFFITKWTSEGQLPKNVHQWLKLQGNVDDAFSADNLNKFMTVVKTLTETVGGKRMLAKILESTGATTSQKKQFASWMDDGVSPKDLMTKIYKESAASASVEENKVVDKLTAFYRSQKAGD
ncbi:hypothetical protein GN958_ATG07657 [Phytophthora infestans]|uniref:Uncharacterized protein n=1 Tax=Phytophthora infestans TaxID=4787 RepID=A0A8S9UTY0_PHYIN|nr:hypothetical protein GN958_ATG07657 [Phytophthora infestans]